MKNLYPSNYKNHGIFAVNHLDAGLAELDVTATSPLGQNLPVEVSLQSDGIHNVQILPTIPGHYRIYLTYGGKSFINI